MTKHIIFDLDGTLIDSMPVWRNTGKRYLESHNIPIPPNLLSVMKKQTLPQTAEFFRQELGATQSVREICDEVISYVADQYANSIPLKPFVKEFLEQEKSKGTKMCILTASEADYIHLALNRLELLPYFEVEMTSDIFEKLRVPELVEQYRRQYFTTPEFNRLVAAWPEAAQEAKKRCSQSNS